MGHEEVSAEKPERARGVMPVDGAQIKVAA
jgi:hypothetical protein